MTTELIANSPTPGVQVPIVTLAAAITSTTATSLTSSAAAPSALQTSGGQFRIVVDSEIMIVTAGQSGTSWTVTRGAEGSTAATHAEGTDVFHDLTADGLQALIDQSASVTSPDGTISVMSGTEIDVVYGTSASTAAEGNDSRITGALQKSGGTMSGAIAMGSSKITGLENGSASSDAAAFGQIPTAGSSTPEMDGTGSAGSASTWSKSDHVHPSDTSRAPIASPTFTGTTAAPEFSASGLTGATAASRWVGATASGAPTSGTFAVGDFVIDQTGFVWVCTTAGSPGTWTKVGGGGSSTAAFAFGTAASRPAAAAGNANTGYFATDTGEVTFSDGTAWHAITHFSSGISTTSIWEQGSGISFDALDNSMTRDNGTGAIRANYTNPGGSAFEVSGGSLDVQSVGSGVRVAEGSNAKQGTATLSAGTVTVSNTSVTATSRIMLTIQSPGGTVGSPYVYDRTAGTSFTIKSTSSSDTSVVAYEIFEVG